jgi:hypothetical protein
MFEEVVAGLQTVRAFLHANGAASADDEDAGLGQTGVQRLEGGRSGAHDCGISGRV